jgi:hypothetical protein
MLLGMIGVLATFFHYLHFYLFGVFAFSKSESGWLFLREFLGFLDMRLLWMDVELNKYYSF